VSVSPSCGKHVSDGSTLNARRAGRLMTAAVVLAIIVVSDEARSPATEAMRLAAAEGLGAEELIAVRRADVLSDREALRVERSLGAIAAVQVTWIGPARTEVRVRLHLAQTNRWIDRVISFDEADTIIERGRTLGFAVTSMLPEETLAAHRPRSRASPPEALSAAESSLPSRAVGLAAIGSAGIDGVAGGVGVAASGEVFVGRVLSMRAGAGAREGPLAAVGGTDLAAYARAGAALWPLPPTTAGRGVLGVRLDVLALHHGLSGETPEHVKMRQGRWLTGMDLILEAGWRTSPTIELVAGLGVEVAFGVTDVFKGDCAGCLVATLPLLRAIAEAGIRLWF
jgi:hypothetical protein